MSYPVGFITSVTIENPQISTTGLKPFYYTIERTKKRKTVSVNGTNQYIEEITVIIFKKYFLCFQIEQNKTKDVKREEHRLNA